MTIMHIVTFRLPPPTPLETSIDPPSPSSADAPINATSIICNDFRELATRCVDRNGKPYILSIKGGRNNSPEGLERGYTHTFIVEFRNKRDRDYYLNEDAVHRDFGQRLVKAADGGIDGVMVFDFEDGED